jgi:hypothetical protein
VHAELERGAFGDGLFEPAEDPGRFEVEQTVFDQFVNGRARLEGGVQLHEGFRPEMSLHQPGLDVSLDVRIGDGQEGADVVRVAVDHLVAEPEYVQRRLLPERGQNVPATAGGPWRASLACRR